MITLRLGKLRLRHDAAAYFEKFANLDSSFGHFHRATPQRANPRCVAKPVGEVAVIYSACRTLALSQVNVARSSCVIKRMVRYEPESWKWCWSSNQYLKQRRQSEFCRRSGR